MEFSSAYSNVTSPHQATVWFLCSVRLHVVKLDLICNIWSTLSVIGKQKRWRESNWYYGVKHSKISIYWYWNRCLLHRSIRWWRNICDRCNGGTTLWTINFIVSSSETVTFTVERLLITPLLNLPYIITDIKSMCWSSMVMEVINILDLRISL